MPRVNRTIHIFLPLLVVGFGLLMPAGSALAADATLLPAYLSGSDVCAVLPSGVPNAW